MHGVTDILLAPMRRCARVSVLAFVPALIQIVMALLPATHAPRMVLWAGWGSPRRCSQ